MKVTDLTRRALAFRREERKLTAQGYRRHETDWEIHRGLAALERYVILDAKVSVCGGYVYTKIGPKSERRKRMITRDKAMQIALQAGNGVDLEKLLPFDGFIERFYDLARADQTEVIRQLVEALESAGVNNGHNGPQQFYDEKLVEAALAAAKPYME